MTAILLGIVTLATVAMEPASRLSGLAWLLMPGAVGFLCILGLTWRTLPTSARVVAGLVPIGIALLVIDGRPLDGWLAALRLPLFLVTFLWAMGMLRQVSMRSPMMHAAGRALLGWRGRARYVIVSLGTMTLSLVLLLGVVGLVGSMIMGRRNAGDAGPDAEQRQALIALSRGYLMMIMISPLSMPFAVVIGAYGDAHWPDMALRILPLLALVWLAGLVLGGTPPATPPATPSTSATAAPARGVERADRVALARTMILVAAIVLTVLVLQAALAIRLVDAVIVTAVGGSVLWLAVQTRRPIADPAPISASAGSEADLVLLASAAFFGAAVAPYLPAEQIAAAVADGAVPRWLIPAFIYAAFIGLGLIAIPPVMAMVLVAGIVPVLPALGLTPTLIAAASLTAWALTALSSPFNPATLALGRVAGLPSLRVSLGWNGVLIGAIALVGSGWMGLLTTI